MSWSIFCIFSFRFIENHSSLIILNAYVTSHSLVLIRGAETKRGNIFDGIQALIKRLKFRGEIKLTNQENE